MPEALQNLKNSNIHTPVSTEENKWRVSTQPLLGSRIPENLNPFHTLGSSKIFSGYESLTNWIIEQKTVIIDGYGGIFFDQIIRKVQEELELKGLSVKWQQSSNFLKPEAEINKLVTPYLGAKDDVWGTRTQLELKDFYNLEALSSLQPDPEAVINIVVGTGAALVNWDVPVIYFDIPKNEIQYRMRAKSITNIGQHAAERSFSMYKRFYFVDWVILDQHRANILNKVAIVADGQRFNEVTWLFQPDLLAGLKQLSHSVFRVRPWFEKGSWGGQWIKKHIKGINTDEVNYAWSFELITPENGLLFESDGNLLEVSFDFLMLTEYQAILGKHAETFGPYFPIRFDFLDTFDGGNLSIQCHPSKKYIQEMFGETITQDETYYIMDCKPGAKVYLGFQESINPDEFRAVLESSQENKKEIDIEQYVQSFPSHKHDLFLIPNGTVHSSGVNNMVLEISATPYIFTFKMYDWLSLDLNGNPRPINIGHAFNNLRFERKGEVVPKELIAHPSVIDSGSDWKLIHLPTHKEHFYDVQRIEFDTEVTIETREGVHVLMLVEGTSISVEIEELVPSRFNYAETFIIPAATKRYKLINHGTARAKVIKAFLKNNTN